jgi:hypothetical protein
MGLPPDESAGSDKQMRSDRALHVQGAARERARTGEAPCTKWRIAGASSPRLWWVRPSTRSGQHRHLSEGSAPAGARKR